MTLTRKINKKNIKRKTRKQRGGSDFVNFLTTLENGKDPGKIVDIDPNIVEKINNMGMGLNITPKSTFYEIYNITPDTVTPQAIRKRFNKFALKLRATKTTVEPIINETFSVITQIRVILDDKNKRIIYNELLQREEQERLEKERLEREREEAERIAREEKERKEDEEREERERLERERLERKRLEKELLSYNFTNTTIPIKNTIINDNKKGLGIHNIVNNPDINLSKLIKPHFSLTGGRKTYNKRNRLKTTKIRR